MKRLLLAMLAVGALLLGAILWNSDLSAVGAHLARLSPAVLGAIFAAFLLGHVALAGSWLLTLPQAPLQPRWLYRVWKVLMVGSALETVTPLAGLGGEPVKAVLLKRHYAVGYAEASASLVLTRMTDLAAQIAFIALGLGLASWSGVLPPAQRWAALGGLALFAAGIALFWLLQTRRGVSGLRRRLAGRALGPRVLAAFDALQQIEDRLVHFYRGQRGRLALSSLCAFAEWAGNAVAVWVAVRALGYPIGWDDALVIEAGLALTRSLLFFVPGDVGTQEAAQLVLCGAITGSPEAGLALAAIRRSRDLLWIAWGLAIGGGFSLRERPGPLAQPGD